MSPPTLLGHLLLLLHRQRASQGPSHPGTPLTQAPLERLDPTPPAQADTHRTRLPSLPASFPSSSLPPFFLRAPRPSSRPEGSSWEPEGPSASQPRYLGSSCRGCCSCFCSY